MKVFRRGPKKPIAKDNLYLVRMNGLEKAFLEALLDEARTNLNTSLAFSRYVVTNDNAKTLILLQDAEAMLKAFDNPEQVEER